jgi:hypothetical protein
MAITCPKCGSQFDATLFEFGNRVQCDCGTEVEYPGNRLNAGHVTVAADEASSDNHPLLLRVKIANDFMLDGGSCRVTTDERQQQVAIITPPAVPMFQQVVEYLETKPAPRVGIAKREQEAVAAVAICLRWGSYFAVLADPSRSDAWDINDEEVSQIADEEMARMNIEISAALAWWLELRCCDERRYDDLVHRALGNLPTGPKTFGPHETGDMLLACTMPEMAATVRESWPSDRLERDMETAAKHGVRIIANTITHIAWRNGPVEDVHAGRFQGYGLNKRRVLPKAEKAIVRHAQSGIAASLKAADYLRYNDAWPPPAELVLPFMHGLVGPSRWSLTEQSRFVELPIRRRTADK